MPRRPRAVVPGIPHHITQRGNRQAQVFFSDDDRRCYLAWLKDYAEAAGVDLLAYCLMANHIHLVAAPRQPDGLQRLLRPLHARYAQHVNRHFDWSGHLWQGRYFSAALDEPYFWSAMRYVERNPVRAGIARRAEDYRWSSAQAHCGLRHDTILSADPRWRALKTRIRDWPRWLETDEPADRLEALRRHTDQGLPCGSERFVRKLGALTGRALQSRPRGRPRKKGDGKKGDGALLSERYRRIWS
jgi:putative transposase